jgi:hypothetical protein
MNNTSAEYFASLIANDSGMKLLRSRSAHLIISFLYNTFRENHIQIISSDELESKLLTFLQAHKSEEHILEDEAKADPIAQMEMFTDLQSKSKAYVSFWCSEEKSYIIRYRSLDGTPVVELSASIERLFTWLENSEPTQFVGTESRFQNILLQLRDLKKNTTEDPKARIEELKQEQKKIAEEIREIEKTQTAKIYSPVQIKERLEVISKSSRELIGDFRQIEDNFSSILNDIYKEQSKVESTRGSILGYTLDTNSKLKSSAQGQSFSSFWDFISQDRDDEINSLINQILNSIYSQDVVWNDTFLSNLKKYLYQAGRKVVEQNHILTDRINRVLSRSEVSERHQITSLTADVKKEMITYLEKVDKGEVVEEKEFMFIEVKPNLYFPQARYPVCFYQTKDFSISKSFEQNEISIDLLKSLVNQFYIDDSLLKKHALEFRNEVHGSQFTLVDLIKRYPIEKGLSEIVAWYNIAEHDDRMKVDSNENDEIEFLREGKIIKVKVPRMIFL